MVLVSVLLGILIAAAVIWFCCFLTQKSNEVTYLQAKVTRLEENYWRYGSRIRDLEEK